MRLNISGGSMRQSASMEDSASNIATRAASHETESETLWVWIKPAAFYNVIESRYHQNKYLLRRCLSYRRKNQQEPNTQGLGSLEVEFHDLTRTTSPTCNKAPLRLSVIVAVCERLSDREFYPLTAKCVHLRGHDSISVKFGVRDCPLTLLMLVRGNHHDLSLLHRKRTQSLTDALTKRSCFGCVPVGEAVWWYAHAVTNTSAKIRVNHWKNGHVTLGEKSTWDGSERRQTKMLAIERSGQLALDITAASPPPPHSFSFRAVANFPTSATETQTESRSVSLTSTEGEVAFRFVYGSVQLQCVEQRTRDFGCAFCPIKCQDLLGLRYHLAASHDIFTYELETGNLTVIWVHRRMEVFDERGEIFCPTTKELIFSLKKALYMNRAAFLRAKPVPKRRRTNTDSMHLETLLEDADVPPRESKRQPRSSSRRVAAKAMPCTKRLS